MKTTHKKVWPCRHLHLCVLCTAYVIHVHSVLYLLTAISRIRHLCPRHIVEPSCIRLHNHQVRDISVSKKESVLSRWTTECATLYAWWYRHTSSLIHDQSFNRQKWRIRRYLFPLDSQQALNEWKLFRRESRVFQGYRLCRSVEIRGKTIALVGSSLGSN